MEGGAHDSTDQYKHTVGGRLARRQLGQRIVVDKTPADFVHIKLGIDETLVNIIFEAVFVAADADLVVEAVCDLGDGLDRLCETKMKMHNVFGGMSGLDTPCVRSNSSNS